MTTKNGPGEDFISAYSIVYDCNSKKLTSVCTKDSLLESIIVANDVFNFGSWYHVAISFDGCFMSLYVNGDLQQRTKKNFETSYSLSDSVMIGHSGDKKNERFSQGVFDDIMYFHKVLSPQEITDLYQIPNPNQKQLIINAIIKYGAIILFFIGVIILIVFRNKKNSEKQKQQFELTNRISELELKVVKAQMNPHFISNCLAAIQELIYNHEIDKAGLYISKFSYFLRQILNYSDKNLITISQELEIIKLYIELEQLRFKNEFEFQLNIDKNIDIDNTLIPALITQPFIENAIWHGLLLLNKVRNPQLVINIFNRNGCPIIEIVDNGVGRDFTKMGNENSKGTKLIFDKIESLNRLFNTSNYQIEIVDLTDDSLNRIGTKINIQLDNIKE